MYFAIDKGSHYAGPMLANNQTYDLVFNFLFKFKPAVEVLTIQIGLNNFQHYI